MNAYRTCRTFGRLVNHARGNPNLVARKFLYKMKPLIILVAKQDIAANCEVTFDYGDFDPEVCDKNAWLNV